MPAEPVYILPNNGMAYLESVTSELASAGAPIDDGDVAFVGEMLLAQAFAAEKQDADITVIEQDETAAAVQGFVADQIANDRSQEEIEHRLFLSPVTAADVPADWTPRLEEHAVDIPEEDYRRFMAEESDYMSRSPHFEPGDGPYLYSEPGNVGGVFPAEYSEFDESIVRVDLTNHALQPDIYPDVVEEIDAVRPPDEVILEPVTRLSENDFDVVMANSAINRPTPRELSDASSTMARFFDAMNTIGDDDGFHVELYTLGEYYPWIEDDDRIDTEAITDWFASQPGDLTMHGDTVEGRLYTLGEEMELPAFDDEYESVPIRGGEHAFLLHIDPPRYLEQKELEQYVNDRWEGGGFFRKDVDVMIRKAEPGEEVVTATNDVGAETIKTADDGDYVVENPGGERYIIGEETYEEDYEKKTDDHVTTEEFGLHRSVSDSRYCVPVDEPLRFTAPWGEDMYIEAGGMLVVNGDPEDGDIYGIQPKEFERTYHPLDDPDT